jgi:xanthine/uracil permease
MLIFAIMLSLGTSGVSLSAGNFNISGVSLAIITGILLNIILKNKE